MRFLQKFHLEPSVRSTWNVIRDSKLSSSRNSTWVFFKRSTWDSSRTSPGIAAGNFCFKNFYKIYACLAPSIFSEIPLVFAQGVLLKLPFWSSICDFSGVSPEISFVAIVNTFQKFTIHSEVNRVNLPEVPPG